MKSTPGTALAAAAALALCLPAGAVGVRLPGAGSRPGVRGRRAVPRVSIGITSLGVADVSAHARMISMTPTVANALPAPLVATEYRPFLTPSLPVSASLPTGPLQTALGERLNAINEAVRLDPSGLGAYEGLERLYGRKGGRRKGNHGRHRDRRRPRREPVPHGGESSEFVINDEGVPIFGRAAVYYKEVTRMVELYGGRADLSHSLDVMDDTYADVWTKLSAIEAVAESRDVSQENTHIERSLTFIDAVLKDDDKRTAVHTHRAYYHKADNPQSEIEEGIRRLDGAIDDYLKKFRPDGPAENAVGRLDEVVLVWDSRGHQAIKDHLKAREAQIRERFGDRYKFLYLDELASIPVDNDSMRRALSVLVKRYGDQMEGLAKIVEGVIYSRYVGLLLELKTIEHYLKKGHTILQSGEELFDADGMYVTELDVVTSSPEGETSLVEAKSARVELPFEEVLQDKVVRKLATYQKHRAELEGRLGRKIDKIVFSMDVGPLETGIEDDPAVARRLELIDNLRNRAASLTETYGFPVEFLFIFSAPLAGPSR